MPIQRDIPGRIAHWLFRVGTFWAVIVGLLTLISFLSVFGKGTSMWCLGSYALFGFAVWFGWRWRSLQRRALGVSAAFWLFSIIFNSAFVIYLFATDAQGATIWKIDGDAFYIWWWIAVSLASLVAFVLEFSLLRNEK